jgi:sugar lactone lactonase YvrE
MRKLALLVAVACLALGALASGSAAVAPNGTVVMSNLGSPRGLAFDHKGDLYVAEAGRGGAGPCALFSDGLTRCYGPTGRISRLHHGVQQVVADGLPSNAPPAFGYAAALGPHDLSFKGSKAYVTIGMGANPTDPAIAPFRALGMGHLAKVHPDARHPDHWSIETDIAAYEAAHNPIGPPDSNPFGILNQNGRRVLTDAGGNDLLEVHGHHVSLLAVFPARPGRETDSVPTSVVRGPDGAYYVGELTGAGPTGFTPGIARVYRVRNGTATPYGPTWSWIIDIAWGPDGRLYVLEFGHPPDGTGSALYRLESNGSKTPVITGLQAAGGFVFGPHGSIYVSNQSTSPAGEVLRFP